MMKEEELKNPSILDQKNPIKYPIKLEFFKEK